MSGMLQDTKDKVIESSLITQKFRDYVLFRQT